MVHILTSDLPPVRGGLEAWTEALATTLAAQHMRVVVYVCGRASCVGTRPVTEFEVVQLDPLRTPWEAPLRNVPWSEARLAREYARVDLLILRNEIDARRTLYPHERHCIISNFAVGVGYLAMLTAAAVRLPHIAVLVGTDFSRGFRNAHERSMLREVCTHAWGVVCKSGEQAEAIGDEFAPRCLRVIPTSVESPIRRRSIAAQGEEVHFFSDSGLSFHKGSAVLLDSFVALVEGGHRLRLTICGSLALGQEPYWLDRLATMARLVGDRFQFAGYLDKSDVSRYLLSASAYCSATLGEGSSAARLAALCSGIPILTTRCGEWVRDVEPDLSHVVLTPVADARAFASGLHRLYQALIAGELKVDWSAVERARDRFSPDRERRDWLELLHAAAFAS